MGTTYLLDSNIAIYLLKGLLTPANSPVIAQAAQSPAYLSIISKMEILGWKAPTQKEEDECRDFVNDAVVISLSDNIVDKTVEIRRQFSSIKLPDAIIASTAVVLGFTLLTRNVPDFSKVPGLTVVNPFIP